MRKIAFVLLLFSFLCSCDKNEELKQDENLRLKYKGVITVDNDNSRRVVLSFYKDMTYDISTTFSSLNCTRNDGNITELWLNKFNFEKGKYYYFHDINGEFELPEMEPGK